MKVSRREFVSTAGCAAAASLCALPSSAFAASGSPAKVETRCTLLNLESNCALPESLAGMRAALGDSHHSALESEFASGSLRRASPITAPESIVIVPAAGAETRDLQRCGRIARRAVRPFCGNRAPRFSTPRDFAQQQALTKEHFGISIGEPVEIWPQTQSRKSKTGATIQGARTMRAIGHEQIPYVTYRWPQEAHVRDFSRVMPVSAASGHAIAHWRTIPVAWSRNVGAGTLVFLGSPLGPALRAGDAEATALFQSILAWNLALSSSL